MARFRTSCVLCSASLAVLEACECGLEYAQLEVGIESTITREGGREPWTLTGSWNAPADSPFGLMARSLDEPDGSGPASVEWGAVGWRQDAMVRLQMLTPMPMVRGDTATVEKVATWHNTDIRWGVSPPRAAEAWLQAGRVSAAAVSGVVTATGDHPLTLDLDLEFTMVDSTRVRFVGRTTFGVASFRRCD